MAFRLKRAAAVLLTAAVMTAAQAAAMPLTVSAGVVEGGHAADLSSLSADGSSGPGVGMVTPRDNAAGSNSGSAAAAGSGSGAAVSADSSGSGAAVSAAGTSQVYDVSGRACPAGLEADLWEEAKRNYVLYAGIAEMNLQAVNGLRASVGSPALVMDQDLCLAACYRAAQTRKYQHLSHYGASGEFLAYDVARTVLGSDDLYVYENFYYEFSDWVRKYKAPENAQTAEAAANQEKGPGVPQQPAWDPILEFLKEAVVLATEGEAWLTNSPGHYENLVRPGVTRFGIGFSLSPEGQPVLDTMIQLFR